MSLFLILIQGSECPFDINNIITEPGTCLAYSRCVLNMSLSLTYVYT